MAVRCAVPWQLASLTRGVGLLTRHLGLEVHAVAEVAVLNAGGWGTALACVLAQTGHSVTLWARRPALAAELEARRENAAYLPGIAIPPQVTPTASLTQAVRGRNIVVITAISRGLDALARELAPLAV